MKRIGNIKRVILNNLDKIHREDSDGCYEIELSFKDYPSAIRLGRNGRERLQIFMMCYLSEPTREELMNWDLDTLLNWIGTTDDYFDADKPIIDECVRLIKKMEV